MKALGYETLKIRGIAFIDEKKVKIKGSEVGFSLMKIEKIRFKKSTEAIGNHRETAEGAIVAEQK